MPELPEVETVRAGLEPVLRGRRFVQRGAAPQGPALSAARALRRAPDGPQGRAPRPPRQIHPRPSRRRRGAGRASRHDRAVQRAAAPSPPIVGGGRQRTPQGALPASRGEGIQLGDYTYEHGARRQARPPRVHDVGRRGRHLQRRAPLRLHDADPERPSSTQHAFFRGLGVEPLGDDLTRRIWPRRARGQEGRPQGVPDGPAHRRRPRQHLRVRGAVPRRPRSRSSRAARLATKTGKPTPAAVRLVPQIKAVLHDAIRAGGSTLARLQAGRRLASAPSRTSSRSTAAKASLARGRAAGAGCAARRRAAARPSIVPPASADSLARNMEHAHGVRNHHRRDQGPRRARQAQPPQRAQRAERAADRRAVDGARRLRGRRRHRLHRHHRQREGLRRRRRHQGDAVQDLHAGLQGGLHHQVGPRRRAAASRWSPRSRASRSAAAASSP